jgi:magnesium transporter
VRIIQREVNLFFAKNYLVLVLPENKGERLSKLVGKLCEAVESASHCTLSALYYSVFNNLAAEFSATLEALEDKMEALSEAITANSVHDQLQRIGQLRKEAYTHKKLLRALSYIGGQILMDENHLLDKANIHYFRSINTRLMKLYDFADNLYVLSSELLRTYDSKSTVRLNETMNKLTIITLFWGPLTVITGIYGMNFSNMPELGWAFGYPIALGIMAAVSLIIYVILKKKKWL